MKTQKTSGMQDDKARKGLGTVVVLSCVGAACASSPQVVTKTPSPQECPPGAVQVMTERFGIPIGEQRVAVFDDGESRPIAVQEGYTAVRVIERMYDMPRNVRLGGELYFGGERVYARFTEALLLDGELVPVCMESWEEGKRGSEVMERGSDPNTVKIFSQVNVRAVDHFK